MKIIIPRKKRVHQGEMIPPFYGIAYIDWTTGDAITYPLFVNLIVILALDFKRWIKNPRGSF